jgi:hypothetical protein
MGFVLQAVEPQAWDSFVECSPQGNVFCTGAFLAALEAQPRRFFVLEDGEPVIAALMLENEGEILRAPYSYSPYQGVLLGPKYSGLPLHSRFSALLRALEFLFNEFEQRYGRISFCLHPAFEDLRAFSWFHYHEPGRGLFRVDLRYTAWLDARALDDWDAYLGSLRRLRQREYRKATAASLTIENSTDIATLELLHDLIFQRQEIELGGLDRRLVRSITKAALEAGFGELLACKRPDGKIVAMTLFVYDRRCGYSLFGATDPRERDSGAYTFLVLENLKRCRDRRLERVDFVGVNSPQRGDYKLSFNFRPVPYFVATWGQPQS